MKPFIFIFLCIVITNDLSAQDKTNFIQSTASSTIFANKNCNTLANPTIADSKTANSVVTGKYTSQKTGLTAGTMDRITVCTTNRIDTKHRNEVSFKTFNQPISVGDNYQGGIVAYILQPGDHGYNANVTHGLIAAVSDQSTGIQWYNGYYSTTGATGTAIGTGNANTNKIVSSQGTGGYAAQLCTDLVIGAYTDWYLPSIDELNKLCLKSNAIGGFSAIYNYWSSTEHSRWDRKVGAWDQLFFNCTQNSSSDKSNKNCVRCIRTF